MDNTVITGFHQITLDEYLKAKEEIARRLSNITDDYIAVGYLLRQIRDSGAYTQGGYVNINDFAKKEYGLSESAVSRFIAINVKFSIDGYSDKVLPEYKNFGSSKLSEMLTLPDEDCKLITETTTVATIRDLKKFNKEEKEQPANDIEAEDNYPAEDNDAETVPAEIISAHKATDCDDLSKIIIEFFRNEKELLNTIYSMSSYEDIAECINPSGNRTFKKGIHMLFLYDYSAGITLKTMGKGNTSYTWPEFVEKIVEVYKDTYTDHDSVWQNFYKPDTDTPNNVDNTNSAENETEEQNENNNGKGKETAEREQKTTERHKMEQERLDKGIQGANEGSKAAEKENYNNNNENENNRAESETSEADTLEETPETGDNIKPDNYHDAPKGRLMPKEYYNFSFGKTLTEGIDEYLKDVLHLTVDDDRLNKMSNYIAGLMRSYGEYVEETQENTQK